jgi:hypothetical protein
MARLGRPGMSDERKRELWDHPLLCAPLAPRSFRGSQALSAQAGAPQVRAKSVECRKTLRTNDN